MSKAQQHTPGPWMTFVDGEGDIGIYIREPHDTCGPQVARVVTENLDEEWVWQAKADALLIAAAPDLLESLKRILAGQLCGNVDLDAERFVLARAAIARAEGGAA